MERYPVLNMLTILLVVGFVGMMLVSQIHQKDKEPGLFKQRLNEMWTRGKKAIEELSPVVPETTKTDDRKQKQQEVKKKKASKAYPKKHPEIDQSTQQKSETGEEKSWRQKAQKAIEKLDRFINS